MIAHGSLIRLIDALRGGTLILSVLAIVPAGLIGFVALSDFNGRGCMTDEAVQCSDARGVVAVALAIALAGPAVWVALTVLRKLCTVRKGAIDA